MNNERLDRKQRKVRKKRLFMVKVIAFILFIVIVFIAGFYFGKTYSSKSIPVANFDNEYSEEKSKLTDNSDEFDKLNILKTDLVSIMNNKYPTVDLSFAIKNLDTGAMVVHNNKKMNSASIIKLFILETVYNEIIQGKYVLSEEREKELEKMITESDNNAANNFIDDFGGQNEKRKVDETNLINKTIKEKGYLFTELNRKMHDKTPPEGPSGYQNYTCVEDVCKFLEGIYNKTLFEEPYNTYALNLMKNQKRRAKIPAMITDEYNDVIVANKTGELSQVENDAAIIMSDDFNIIFVVLTDNIPFKADGTTDYDLKEEVQKTISKLGLKVVEFYNANQF